MFFGHNFRKSASFCTKSDAYNIKELDIDVKSVNDLASLYRIADKICSGLNDTMMLSGSEAYMAALAYYNSVKSDRRAVATKMNVSGAKRIYEDLNKRFDRTSPVLRRVRNRKHRESPWWIKEQPIR